MIEVVDAPAPVPELGDEQWCMDSDHVELALGNSLQARIAPVGRQVTGRVNARLLLARSDVVARLLLETPAAVLLARSGYAVLHAGAVVGPGGAAVIRGAPGAGKSTLVAAACQAGLGVLGDETILAAREDPDELLAAVRDITLLPDAARLLGLEGAVAPAGVGPDAKQRLNLFPTSSPQTRRARRAAAVVLGPRDDGPAQLEALTAEAFVREFRAGEITQERWSGTPPHIAAHWSRHRAYRLSGTADLAGALDLLAQLVSAPTTAYLS